MGMLPSFMLVAFPLFLPSWQPLIPYPTHHPPTPSLSFKACLVVIGAYTISPRLRDVILITNNYHILRSSSQLVNAVECQESYPRHVGAIRLSASKMEGGSTRSPTLRRSPRPHIPTVSSAGWGPKCRISRVLPSSSLGTKFRHQRRVDLPERSSVTLLIIMINCEQLFSRNAQDL